VATREFGIRDLRNHTSSVLAAVGAGDVVYLTNRGVRVAEIRPIEPVRRIDVLLRRAAEISMGDTGALDELMADKAAAIAAERGGNRSPWG
jgi:prevent-host-death family protein